MCTGIKINYDDGCVMGRTMDYEVPLKYSAIYFPREYNYSKDLLNKPLHSKYRSLGIRFENHYPLKDAINEHGLIGITNIFTGFNLYASKVDKDKKNISSLDYMNYAIMNYKSVEELVDDLPNIHIANRDVDGENVITPDFHFMFADGSKRSVVIEPRKGKLISYENPYDVMTNSPAFPSHIRRLEKFFDLDNLENFNAPKDLPGGYDPSSRFIKAFYLTRMNAKSNNYKDALANAYSIMGAVSMPNGFVHNKKYNHTTYTRYICAYDTNNKILTVKTHSNPTVYQLGFEDISDLDKKEEFLIKTEFSVDKLK